jgi:shikimate kinase
VSDARPRHVVLVGLMGAGKSTVGARCAERMGRAFVDTDAVVESIAGAPVADLFAHDGEAAFRELERSAVADACAAPVPIVIAAGGGAVLDAENRKHLRDAGFVVWLRAPAAQLAARVGDGRGRPLLSADPAGTLERLATVRLAAYEAAAHATIDTDGMTVAAVVDDVLARFAATAERVP